VLLVKGADVGSVVLMLDLLDFFMVRLQGDSLGNDLFFQKDGNFSEGVFFKMFIANFFNRIAAVFKSASGSSLEPGQGTEELLHGIIVKLLIRVIMQ